MTEATMENIKYRGMARHTHAEWWAPDDYTRIGFVDGVRSDGQYLVHFFAASLDDAIDIVDKVNRE